MSWTISPALHARGLREGWAVFESGLHGPQVQRIDEPDDPATPRLPDDDTAIALARTAGVPCRDDGVIARDLPILQAIAYLRRARTLLAQAQAGRSCDKVRAALKSAEGAARHARHDRARATRREDSDTEADEDDGERTGCDECGDSWNVREGGTEDTCGRCTRRAARIGGTR